MRPDNPLELDPARMRELGHQVVDLLVDRIASLDSQPAWRGAGRAELEARLRTGPPTEAEPFESLLRVLREDVLEHAARVDHPRFLGFVPGSPTWPGVLADFIASAHNVFAGSWLGGSGPAQIELVVLDWFKEWLGLPANATGLFTSGGSAATLMALAAARQLRTGAHDPRLVLYLSSECHSSVERAARILGFAPERVRKLEAGDDYTLDPPVLTAAIDADRAAGLTPFLAVVNAGSTSTGAVDPLPALADVCTANDVWLHVDAAYGGFAVLTERGRRRLAGIERADSLTLDPHKWLYQPFEAGCLLLRRPGALEDAFRIQPEYLQDAAIASGPDATRPVNFMDRGLQLTRSPRALKVWLSLRFVGIEPFREAIARSIALALDAESRIRASSALELLTPASLGIVCFRRMTDGGGRRVTDAADLERLNASLVRQLAESGLGLISSTRTRGGTYALRFCIMGHRTGPDDVASLLDWLESTTPD
jgi:glutamate/tyrosine decarboxylase-like PLP-dependent enzyme